jgi:hypothetical protein
VTEPLIAAATRKSGLIWVGAPARPQVGAWHVWEDEPPAAYVVTGRGEQSLPGLAEATEALVTVRSSDTLGRIVTWRAAVERLEPGTDDWERITAALLAKRLNNPDGPAAVHRWAAEGAVLRLTPVELAEAGETLPAGSLAEPPRPTPATSRMHRPYQLRFWNRRKKKR